MILLIFEEKHDQGIIIIDNCFHRAKNRFMAISLAKTLGQS